MKPKTVYRWPEPKPPCIDDVEWTAIKVFVDFHADDSGVPHRQILASALRKLVAHALRSEGTPTPCHWCQQESCYCCPECGHDVRVDHAIDCP